MNFGGNTHQKYDVFFGRGRMVSKLPGNIKYKELLYANYKAYNLSQSRYERDMIAETIVSTLKQLGTTFWYVPVKAKCRSGGDDFTTIMSRGKEEKKICVTRQHSPGEAGKASSTASPCASCSSSSPRVIVQAAAPYISNPADDITSTSTNHGQSSHESYDDEKNNGSNKRQTTTPGHHQHDVEVLSEFDNGSEQQEPRSITKNKQNPAIPPPNSLSASFKEAYDGWEELKPRGKVLRKVKQVRSSSFCNIMIARILNFYSSNGHQ